MNKAYVAKSGVHGRGVYAKQDIPRNRLIDISPVIIFGKEDAKIIDSTVLYQYYYEWTKDTCAFAAGLGSMFNHSPDPNARYEMDYKNKTIRYIARRLISKGEEIFINYNGDAAIKKEINFD